MTNKKIYGLDIVEINSIEYNGDDITEKCVTDNIPIDIKFGEKKDFDNTTQVAFEECFTITKDNPAKFIVNLTTRCPKEDITSSFRASVPCKQFSVNYKIESDEYKIKAYSFAICKQVENSSNKSTPKEASIKFSDWVFTDDGVVAIICKT